MLYVYEFELIVDDDYIVAFPFDFEGGTQGVDYAEVAEMAADWLRCTIEGMLMDGDPIPEPTLGHAEEGKQVLLVAIDVSLDTIDKVSASEAAEILGVTPGRISQMLKTARLIGYKDGRNTWVTRDSVNARLAESPKAGRPKKAVAV